MFGEALVQAQIFLYCIIVWLFVIAVLAFAGFKWSAALLFILPIIIAIGGVVWVEYDDRKKRR